MTHRLIFEVSTPGLHFKGLTPFRIMKRILRRRFQLINLRLICYVIKKILRNKLELRDTVEEIIKRHASECL